tara:strand:+ start:6936 stop:7844 length:909 start_codon:yes stop_codon:yes gene_type:complete
MKLLNRLGKYLGLCMLLLGLAACSSGPRSYETPPAGQGSYKVGKPYKVAGKVYYPKEDPTYSAVGLASWYGPKFHGRKTANGEIFDMNALTAAHTTLPMPSYVRVTNLENGRSLILRVNDRGPFVGNRLIDVSRRAAQLLGFERQGVTKVRVEAVPGPDAAPVYVRRQTPPSSSSPSSSSLAQPAPKRAPVVVAEETTPTSPPPAVEVEKLVSSPPQQETAHKEYDLKTIYVQIGAFADKLRAEAVADGIRHVGQTLLELVDVNGQKLYRVRIGPLESREQADVTLGRVLAWGHNTARIVMD